MRKGTPRSYRENLNITHMFVFEDVEVMAVEIHNLLDPPRAVILIPAE